MECRRCGFPTLDQTAPCCDVCGYTPFAAGSPANPAQTEIPSQQAAYSDSQFQLPSETPPLDETMLLQDELQIACPACNQPYRIGSHQIGMQFACQSCQNIFSAAAPVPSAPEGIQPSGHSSFDDPNLYEAEQPNATPQSSAPSSGILKFQCPSCQKKYKSAREKLSGRSAIKCKQCGNRFAVPVD